MNCGRNIVAAPVSNFWLIITADGEVCVIEIQEVRYINEEELDSVLQEAMGSTHEARYTVGDILVVRHEQIVQACTSQGMSEKAAAQHWNEYLADKARTLQVSKESLRQYWRVAREIPRDEREAAGEWRSYSVLRAACGKDKKEREWIYEEACHRSIESIMAELCERERLRNNPGAVTMDDVYETAIRSFLTEAQLPYEKHYRNLYGPKINKVIHDIMPLIKRMLKHESISEGPQDGLHSGENV